MWGTDRPRTEHDFTPKYLNQSAVYLNLNSDRPIFDDQNPRYMGVRADRQVRTIPGPG